MSNIRRLPEGLTPAGLNLRQAAAYCGVAINSFYKLMDQGLMPRGRAVLGGRLVWLRTELDAALAALPRAGGAAPGATKTPALQEWD